MKGWDATWGREEREREREREEKKPLANQSFAARNDEGNLNAMLWLKFHFEA